MGPKKSQPKAVHPPKTIQHKDHYARVSYLYQASNLLLSKGNPVLSRNYSRAVDLVAKKTVMKLSPGIKRTLCKNCSNLLIPGITQATELQNMSKLQSEKSDVLVHTCLICYTSKRFPVGKNRDYQLFYEKDGISHGVD